MNCILCMNSVSGLCLCLRDTKLYLTATELCRWLVESDDVEVVHVTPQNPGVR